MDVILIHSHRRAMAVVVVVVVLLNLREKRSVPLTSPALHVLKILVEHQLKTAALADRGSHRQMSIRGMIPSSPCA